MDDPKRRIDELARGFQHSAVLLTGINLGLYAAMGDGAHDAATLAAKLGVDARALEVLLLALAAEEIVTKETAGGAGRFRLDPQYAPYLIPGGEQSQTHILNHNYHMMTRWVRLPEIVRSGRPIPRDEGDATQLRAFICGMADISRASSREVAEKFDFSAYRKLLDLGGGPGTSAITFAQRNPELEAVVFDLPPVLEIAREEIAAAGLATRIKTLAGDYYTDPIGGGYDIIYVSNIIHSMAPEDVAMLIGKCAAALTAGGALVIKEFFLDDDRVHPPAAALFSVNMLVGTEGGRSYTAGETREMMARAGFGGFATTEVAMHSKLLVGRKAG